VSDRRFIGYASGNFGKNTVASFLDLFALYYFTDVLGLAPAVAGTVLLVSLLWDGFADPVMGLSADRLRLRLTTVRVFFLIGVPVTAASLIAIFLAGEVPAAHRTAYLVCCLMVFRTAYTSVDVPHNSMLGFLSSDSRERTNIAGLRIFFSGAGKLVVSLGAAYFLEGPLSEAVSRFAGAAAVFAIVYVVVMAISARAIWQIRISALKTAPFSWRKLVGGIATNRPLLVVLALTAVTSLSTPAVGIALVYVAQHGVGESGVGAGALTLMALAQTLSPLFWSKLSNRLPSKAHAAQMANGVLVAAGVCGVFAIEHTAVMYAVAATAGFAFGGIFMLNWSMLPDALTADSGTSRYELSVFALYSLTNKIAHGFAQACAGWTLAGYGYVAGAETNSAVISPIAATLFAAPLAGASVCIALLRCYRLRH